MAKKHTKRCSTSLAIREVHTKPMRYHIHTENGYSKKIQILPNVDEDVEKLKPSHIYGSIKLYSYFAKQFGSFFNS